MTEKKEQSPEDVVSHEHAGIILAFRFITNLMKAEVKRLQKERRGE